MIFRTIKLRPKLTTQLMEYAYDEASRLQRMYMIEDALYLANQIRRIRRALDLVAAYGAPVTMIASYRDDEPTDGRVTLFEIKGE